MITSKKVNMNKPHIVFTGTGAHVYYRGLYISFGGGRENALRRITKLLACPTMLYMAVYKALEANQAKNSKHLSKIWNDAMTNFMWTECDYNGFVPSLLGCRVESSMIEYKEWLATQDVNA